jgi:chaperonin GroES
MTNAKTIPGFLREIPELTPEEMAELQMIQPMGDRIIVLPCNPEKVSRGGIIIPDTAQESSYRGMIVAKGPGNPKGDGTYERIEAEIGDIILYGKYSGSDWNPFGADEKKKLLIMRETDIAVKLGKKPSK